MKAIKFRVWDDDNKMFSYWSFDNLEILRSKVDSFWDYFSASYIKDNPGYAQEYTGLKDKKNKEIYEGDILIWHNGTDDPDKDIDPVSFERGCFKCGNDLLDDLDLDEMEIIGNIYENPELLKGQNNG